MKIAGYSLEIDIFENSPLKIWLYWYVFFKEHYF